MSSFTIPGTSVTVLLLSSIIEGERFRKDYGDLSELTHSIKTQGLINPLTVTPDSEEEGKYRLVAGGRRLAALKKIGEESALCRIYTNPLNELDLRILELAENLQRKDMTWSEENSLHREIHRLQQAKYGKATPGGVGISEDVREALRKEGERQVVGPVGGWRMEDTAAMLGVSKAQIQSSIAMADKFDKYKAVLGDPSKYKTENDARKAIKIVEESLVRAELAKRMKAKTSSTSFLSRLNDAYNIGDAIEGLSSIPSETINFMEIDPPYSISLNSAKKAETTDDYQEIPAAEFILTHRKILSEAYRALKQDSFCLYWFAIDPWLEILYQTAREVGFEGNRIPLIWTKPNGQSLSPDRNLANAYETALILKKGSPILAKPGRINVFSYPPVPPQNKYHPTQKPLELYTEIYMTFSFEGSSCCSPFLGSGVSILAANTIHRTCFGWDLSETFKGGYLSYANELFLGE